MRISTAVAVTVFTGIGWLCSVPAMADDKRRSAPDDEIMESVSAAMESVIDDVIGGATERAREVVRENTGIDISKRPYGTGREYNPLPDDASDEARRELIALQSAHDRKIQHLQEELDRKLAKAQAAFEREASKENKAEKVHEKRAKLQEKVDAAYDKFDQKVREENERFDKKRDHIVSKQRGEMAEDRSEGRPDEGRRDRRREAERAEEDRRDRRREAERAEEGRPDRGRRAAGPEGRPDTERDSEERQAGQRQEREREASVREEQTQKRWWQFWKD